MSAQTAPEAGNARHNAVFFALLRRDLSERHQGSLLGIGWNLLQPLLQLAVLSLVFTHLLPARAATGHVPYAAFLALGLWPWQLFANALTRGTSALTDNAALIGKVALPHALYVLARVLGSVLPDLVGMVLVLLAVAAFGVPLSLAGLPVTVLALLVVLAYGVAAALIASVLQVFLRDVGFAVGQLLTLGFFISPVLYDRAQLPEPFAIVLGFNPLAAPIESIRAGLLGLPVPWIALGASAAFALIALLFAHGLFARARPHIEDFL
ncbi:MAG: ABC transporter permease [Xanthomonadaceae bacterium]|nr:ABC transporter permease [Xanthomonadaceae bacterium]MDP2184657.1 ABC transporter permease [Xanthomonadales bacterium]MDZ4116139.1 ABC transporter permease [Xanthomonadaceae bacterium]MDZ4378055.1 ABC transporter permease [Xanthomonadaceae bacterium]